MVRRPRAVFLGVLLVYALSMPVHVQDNYDAVAEVRDAVAEGSPWRPAHLLLTSWYRGCAAVLDVLPGPTFIHLQAVNAFCGALAAALMVVFLRRRGVRPRLAVLAALVMAFSSEHWLNAREVESAMVAQVFLMGALCLVAFVGRDDPRGRVTTLSAAAGAAMACSVLFAMNVVVIVPAAALLLWVTAGTSERVRATLVFLATSIALVGIPYLVVVHNVTGSLAPSPAISWMTHHASTEALGEAAGSVSPANLLRAASGFINTFFGYTAVTTAVKLSITGRGTIPVATSDWVRFTLGVTLFVFVALHYTRRIDAPRRIHSGDAGGNTRWVFAVALAMAGVFNVLWLGSDPQFWLPIVPLFLLYPALVASRRPGRFLPTAWGVAATILLAVNLSYAVPTLADPRGGEPWQRARDFRQIAGPGDLLIYTSGWGKHVHALGSCHTIDIVYKLDGRGEKYVDALTARIDSTLARGDHVYALEVFDVTSSTAIGMWERIHNQTGLSRGDIVDRLNARYRATPVAPETFGDRLSEIMRPQE